ncbi:hypothetical protein BDW71DRAFT_172517 [Aspergillus fruticulosus]
MPFLADFPAGLLTLVAGHPDHLSLKQLRLTSRRFLDAATTKPFKGINCATSSCTSDIVEKSFPEIHCGGAIGPPSWVRGRRQKSIR